MNSIKVAIVDDYIIAGSTAASFVANSAAFIAHSGVLLYQVKNRLMLHLKDIKRYLRVTLL
jgi:hypothetical protein